MIKFLLILAVILAVPVLVYRRVLPTGVKTHLRSAGWSLSNAWAEFTVWAPQAWDLMVERIRGRF